MITINVVVSIGDFDQAVGLILILAGALVLVFSLFRTLLPFSEENNYFKTKYSIVIITSLLLIFLGMVLGNR